MPITVSMIEEKEFKIKMRGYDPVEVDEMLDEICDEMIAMQDEIATLQSRLKQAQAGQAYAPAVPAPAPAAVPAPAAPVFARQEPAAEDDSAQRLLARAQKFYDETVAEAKAEAEKILNSARQKTDAATAGLKDEKAALEEEIEMLKAAARDYRNRFRNLVKDQEHILNTEKELFE